MKRLALALCLTLTIAACGGGEEAGDDGGTTGTDTGTTATTASDDNSTTTAPPTTSGGVVLTGNFCEDADNNEQLIDGIDFLSSDIEAAMKDWLAVIAQVEAEAPSEIADDVSVIANAARQFDAILADANYQILEVDPDDPRMEAFNDDSLEIAGRNIAEYCGWDYDEPAPGDGGAGDIGTGGGTGGFGNDEIPSTVPEAIIPPDVLGVNDNGAAGVNVLSSTSLDDLVAFYTDAIGEPDVVAGSMATFSGEVDGDNVFVIIDDLGDQRVVTILVLPG